MRTITTEDGTQVDFKEWDTGQPVGYSHGRQAAEHRRSLMMIKW